MATNSTDPFVDSQDESVKYDYDLIVLGGGSGGLASGKAAAAYGKKVAICDFVKPSTQGTVWGLGGTCVNVGCIPKKLFHTAALLKEGTEDSREFGFEPNEKVPFKWETLVENVDNHVKSLNFGYKVQLREKNVDYKNAFASFEDAHTLTLTARNKTQTKVTSKRFLIAVGGRPIIPDIPGLKEAAITSDDIFQLQKPPGKTCVIGAAYIALECAGFLTTLGFDTTVLVRSQILRGFDQDVAEMIAEYMKSHGTKFKRDTIPIKVETLPSGRHLVTYKTGDKEEKEEFDTILVATGRYPVTDALNLEKVGVKTAQNGKVIIDKYDRTSVPHIYALGDCAVGQDFNVLELTPLAIQMGKLLAARLYGGKKTLTQHHLVPTTVFTPLEYGCVGYTEEEAEKKFGKENLEVYHTHFKPLEWTVPHREDNACYMKIIVNQKDNERVVGAHVLSPNAGEVIQGYAVALRAGATKETFDDTIGIHPTISEEFTSLNITKSSGLTATKTGC